MTRVLLAIGCDEYDSDEISNLSGASADAKCIFDRLVSCGLGAFDSKLSRILLSPTLSDVRAAVTEILFSTPKIDVLTIFYAGHGGVKDGSYFLMCRDSYVNRLSVSALPISHLFGWIGEAKCRHVDVIIDSCQSGGVVYDLGSLLKPDVVGKSNGLSVSMLVAASSDQFASEVGGQGICTGALIKCIDGKLPVPSQRSTLDLIEVGKVVSEFVSANDRQKPLVWGLSLFGHVPLCKNPSFSENNFPSFSAPLIGTHNEAISQKMKSHADALWLEYYEIERDFSVDRLMLILTNIVDEFSEDPAFVSEVVSGILSTMSEQVSKNYSNFEKAQVFGIGIAALLHLTTSNIVIENLIIDLCRQICETLDKGIDELLSELNDNKYALISRISGMADLFYLPLRVLNILGWVACAKHISSVLKCDFQEEQATYLVRALLEKYGASIVSVSDTQAPSLATLLSVSKEMGIRDECELILGLMFNSYLTSGGKVAHTSIRAEDVLNFLTKRSDGDISDYDHLLAQPSDLLSVFMVCYPLLNMKEEIDDCMLQMDHFYFNIFCPASHLEFSKPVISLGKNYSYLIGDSIWRIDDFLQQWNGISAYIASDHSVRVPAVRLGSIVSSLLFPNRVAWLLFSEQTIDSESNSNFG